MIEEEASHKTSTDSVSESGSKSDKSQVSTKSQNKDKLRILSMPKPNVRPRRKVAAEESAPSKELSIDEINEIIGSKSFK